MRVHATGFCVDAVRAVAIDSGRVLMMAAPYGSSVE